MNLTGINLLFELIGGPKVAILWYHGVCQNDFELLKGYSERHIPKFIFEKHLSYLNRHGYTFATMSEYLKAIESKKLPKKMAVLTFDDGFKNVVANAYPLLKKYKAKGCFYLVSSLVNSENFLWTDLVETVIREKPGDRFSFEFQGSVEEYGILTKKDRDAAMMIIKGKLKSLSNEDRVSHMRQFERVFSGHAPDEFSFANWQDIRSLDPSILEIGSHTRTHPLCENLTRDDEFRYELDGSKQDLERELGRPVVHFNYPAGSYNTRVAQEVRSSGYQSAVTTNLGFSSARENLYEISRIGTSEDLYFFKSSVSGSYFFFKNIFTRIRGGS